jgi:hypothetical protein
LEEIMPFLNTKNLSTVPTRFSLCHLFERIIRSWGADHIQSLGEMTSGPGELPIERLVRLSGTLNGTLIVRTSPGFLAWLQNQRSGTFLGRYPADEIFEELISLFCLYLFHDFWNPATFHIGPIQPVRPTPPDRPPTRPHAACTLLVEDHPVEIRLWMRD